MTGMLASVLVQLATNEERHQILVETYQVNKHKGPPSLQSLEACFDRMLNIPNDVFLILDALDEHVNPRSHLLTFIAGLAKNSHVHLLVVSRSENDILSLMKEIQPAEINLNAELKQRQELHRFISQVLEFETPFRTWKDKYPSTLNLIKERLIQEHMLAPIINLYSHS